MEVKKLKLPWLVKDRVTTVVVYKKSKSSKTHYMVITDHHVDVINNARATKPIIEHNYNIVEMSVGISYVTKYAKQYKIKKPIIISKYKY